MSNTKVSSCSSIRLPSTTNVKSVALRTVTKDKMVHIDMEKAKKRTKEAKPARPLDLLPLKSPQLIRAKVYAQANSGGWNSSIKVKSSSSSSGSNSVESIVPKYKVSMNSSSVVSQKRIFLNQTPTQKPGAKKMQDTKSFSSKFPQGLPFEAEFYHKRLSSVASDSTSNVSSDEFASSHRPSKSPYANPEFERNPSNDALYVDFTLKPFDNATIPGETNKTDTKKHNEPPLSTRSIKTKYILTDENCFCEFETQRKNQTGASCKPSVNSKPNKDLVVYVTSAHIFPQCNRPKTVHESVASKNT